MLNKDLKWIVHGIFKILLQHVAKSTEENLKGLTQYRCYFGLDPNQVPDKWETEVRIAVLRLKIIQFQ
jgi:hypothetical protein